MTSELPELFEQYLRNELSAERAELLAQALHESSDARREFVTYLQEYQLLAQVSYEMLNMVEQEDSRTSHATSPIVKIEKPAALSRKRMRSRPLEQPKETPSRFKTIATIAASFLFVGGSFLLYRQYQASNTVIAYLQHVEHAVTVEHDGEENGALQGVQLNEHDVVTTSPKGSAVIAFPNEKTVIRLYRDTKVKLWKRGRAKQLMVEGGKIYASVDPQPDKAPMLIFTPHAQITVLSTRFNICVHRDNSRIQLMKGHLRIEGRKSKERVDIFPGEYADVSSVSNIKKGLLSEKLDSIIFQDGVSPNVTYSGTLDTDIQDIKSESNWGRGNVLKLGRFKYNDDPFDVIRTDTCLIKWDISRIPVHSTIIRATITFDVRSPSLKNIDYRIYPISRDWSEYETTWMKARNGVYWQVPGAKGPLDRASMVMGKFESCEREKDLTIALTEAGVSQVEKWVDDPGCNFGMIIESMNKSDRLDGVSFSSREAKNRATRPRLAIEYISPGP